MQRLTTVFGLVTIAASLSACEVERITFGDAAGRSSVRWEPWIETDRTTYIARFTAETIELDIGYTFTNHSRQAVAIPRCTRPHSPVLDKLIAGEWVEVLVPVELCWDEPALLGPGRSQHFTYRLRAGRPHTFIQPQFRTGQIPGTYRLRWDVYEYDRFSQFGIGAPLPIEHRVSNEFRITL